MDNITELFDSILDQAGSLDMAESDFKRMLLDDADMHRVYRRWCSEHDTTERHGFLEYGRERNERREGGWDIFSEDEDL